MQFTFSPAKEGETSAVTVTDVMETVAVTVTKDGESAEQDDNMLCDIAAWETSKYCEFVSDFGATYTVTIIGEKSKTELFTILYN